MSYIIIGDSCTDFTKEQRESGEYEIVPLTLDVDGREFTDDDSFDQKAFLKAMKGSKNCPKSACPAPEAYMERFADIDDVYIVTLSSRLSGSYNSARLSKELYQEQHGGKNIAVIDSKSASCGQMLIAKRIKELADSGRPFEQVEKQACAYRDRMDTMFVLESLDNLRKNGRLSAMQSAIINALNIKPVMGATPEGEIDKRDQTRGMNRALVRMVEMACKRMEHPEEYSVAIAHCNNEARARFVKSELEKRASFREILISETAGVSTLYANDGGIVMAY